MSDEKKYEFAMTHPSERIPVTRATPPAEIKVSLLTMQHSSGFPDYFAQVRVENRTLEFFMSKSKGRTEYHVAELEWLFNNAPKPDILAFDADMPKGFDEYMNKLSLMEHERG